MSEEVWLLDCKAGAAVSSELRGWRPERTNQITCSICLLLLPTTEQFTKNMLYTDPNQLLYLRSHILTLISIVTSRHRHGLVPHIQYIEIITSQRQLTKVQYSQNI